MSDTTGFRDFNQLREYFLDNEYHDTYTEERRRLQDCIIDSLLPHRAESKAIDENQWMICTAGPMASGKSYVVQWILKEKQCFKELRRSMVMIDYDQIRKLLPEASQMTAESGIIQLQGQVKHLQLI